ncbi:MAG: hypothetical protein B6D63_03235 [Candidatus Latescibacteria bacterium 4484_7]|nr:MAG: hypothetical protein B6D63_03235 [Candidatus Latescibacteria bacterium 4484_7]
MELKKELGLVGVFSVATGAMISSGLFILPGIAHAAAGPAVILSYMLGGLIAFAGILSVAELATAMPRSGGDYFFIARVMGPAAGTVAGLLSWFSLSLKSAFALVGMAAFTSMFVDIDIRIIASVMAIIFISVNVIGIKEAGRIQVVLVIGLVALLLFYIVSGIPRVKITNIEPFAPNGVGAIISTAGFVFISYGGLLKVVSVAEEIKNPSRNIPLGMILSLVVVSILYTLVVLVTTGVLSRNVLDGSLTPISDGAAAFLGEGGRIALGVAAILAFVSTANAGIMSASRYPLGLSRDGLFPSIFAKVHRRFKTPVVSIILTGAVVVAFLFLEIKTLVKVASAVVILTNLLSCISVIVMREGKIQNYRPSFKSPLYPWTQIAGSVAFALLLTRMGNVALIATASLVFFGIAVYVYYGRSRVRAESALLYLIERITDKELTTGMLETELRDIIRERDEIVKDRFDRIIERGNVLDLKGPVMREEFFEIVADRMSKRLGMHSSDIVELLKKREIDSSTVLNPFLAIPHIVMEGEGKFCILIARCKEGIVFSDDFPSVKAVFVLMGTRDERNFHLKSLAAIAQIVSEEDFEKKWLDAKNEHGLIDVILLGKRLRDR